MLRLLRKRDFALLISGQAVSDVGDGTYAVALAWRVYQSYSTPAALSVVGIAFFIPRLLVTIAGGVLSDRIERRWTMIGADCGRAVAVGLLAAISFSPRQEPVAIVLLVEVQGVAGSLFGPTESALLPQLVSAEELGRANSLRTVITPLASAVAGPALGGAITASAGPQAAFWIDAGTYAVSVVTLLFMGFPSGDHHPAGPVGSCRRQTRFRIRRRSPLALGTDPYRIHCPAPFMPDPIKPWCLTW